MEIDASQMSQAPAGLDTVIPPPAQKRSPRPHIYAVEQYKDMHARSLADPEGFWGDLARNMITWDTPFRSVAAGGHERGDFSWFHGGTLNVAYNCIDRHALANPDKTAIIWEADEPGEHKYISYAELLANVCQVANLLAGYGLKKGDYVAIYMPMVPEAAYAMLACARLGLVHCVVFAGFSADALRDRINDSGSTVVFTVDESRRGGKSIKLKGLVDQALLECPGVKHCVVLRRTGAFGTPMHAPRDVWWHDAVDIQRPYCDPVPVSSEDHLFNMYTSGSTGKPKGLIHGSAGYLLQAMVSFKYVFDFHEGDIFGCTADVGWITGHSYLVYGPLAMGATTLMFEGIPTFPDAGRFWQIVETHRLTHLYTAPTAIRTLQKAGDSFVRKHDRTSLRILGSVGEPISPEAWKWFFEVCGDSKCSVVDTYWQSESGSILLTPLPGAHAMKPGSCTLPFFGIEPVILDVATGKELRGNGVTGILAIKLNKGAWPSIARTVLQNHPRYHETYFKAYPGYYFTGDGAARDKDGYYWIRGRVDDVVNVSGHRISTSEVEAALAQHPACAEAASVGIKDEITGQAVVAFVVTKQTSARTSPQEVQKEMIDHVRQTLGPFSAPKRVYAVADLPKTRSGKIMRRILRKIADGDVKSQDDIGELGDLSTLSDPGVVPAIIDLVHKPQAKL
ncbi:acetate-CoA ligase [Hyaloraphidium curvatum]|nr:acetate-CoA ligase [Hyaloraphidium curvatum]